MGIEGVVNRAALYRNHGILSMQVNNDGLGLTRVVSFQQAPLHGLQDVCRMDVGQAGPAHPQGPAIMYCCTNPS